jgi:hypothetical protein
MTDTNVAAGAVDLTAFMPADEVEFEVLDQAGIKGTGWKMRLAGPSHPKAVAWNQESSRRTLRKQAQLEAQQFNRRKVKPEEREPDEVRLENVQWVVAHILSWTPVAIGGETITFSEEAATKLLVKPEMGWVFAQLVEKLADDKSFMKGSAKN